MAFQITGDPAADRVLEDPFALVLGMLLDQQYPMDNALQQGTNQTPVCQAMVRTQIAGGRRVTWA